MAAAQPSSVPPSHLPALRVLHIEGCQGLRRLRLSHTSLTRLSLLRCGKLRAVALAAPSLQQLRTLQCDALHAIGLHLVPLLALDLGERSAASQSHDCSRASGYTTNDSGLGGGGGVEWHGMAQRRLHLRYLMFNY